MARRILNYTAETRQRWLSEGRGQGDGKNYKGWLTTHDVNAPVSYKSRLIDRCHMRLCHLLSSIEERGFLYFDYCRSTLALYDQYRLDLDETIAIAKQLGIEHPRVPGTREYWDMTTDLVCINHVDNEKIMLPRSCKMAKDLGDWNNIEHAEIERVYWRRRNRTLKFITEEDRCIPNVLANNLQILKSLRFLQDEVLPYEGFVDEMRERMQHELARRSHGCSLTDFSHAFDVANSLEPGRSLRLALHFIYQHALIADLMAGDLRMQNVDSIKVNEHSTQRNHRASA